MKETLKQIAVSVAVAIAVPTIVDTTKKLTPFVKMGAVALREKIRDRFQK